MKTEPKDDRLHRFVAALTAHFGDRALAVVERQAASAAQDPDVALVWRRIATRISQTAPSR